jgi:hypothetical protein
MARTLERTSRTRGTLHMARTRGMMAGLALVLLGAWGALVPFFGPLADYAYTPDDAFDWTAGRFWMSVLPGAVAVLGGLMLLMTTNRAVAVTGGWLGAAAGAWFVTGPLFGQYLPDNWGDTGQPVGGNTARTVEQLGFFTGLGVVMVLCSGLALGRIMVRSLADIRAAEDHHAQKVADREAAHETDAVVPAAAHRTDTHDEVYEDDPRLADHSVDLTRHEGKHQHH